MTERERLRERERVATIFEAHRAAPGTPYDESHFLDFLLANPAKRRAVNGSLAGLRRLNAFLNQIQLEYSIHFSRRDRDANYPLDAFVARVMELRATPRSSLSSFDAHPGGIGWIAVVLSNLAVLLPALTVLEYPKLLMVLAVLLVGIDAYWFWSHRRHLRYNEILHRQLLAADEAHRKQAGKARVAGLG